MYVAVVRVTVMFLIYANRQSSSHTPFLVRPIWPSLGALCPSLWGLAPPPSPLTWGCPGLYSPAGPGCRGGPLGGMSSGIPEAPYISPGCAFSWLAARCPHCPGFVSCQKASHFRNGIQQWMYERHTTECWKWQRESPRSLWKKVNTFVKNSSHASESGRLWTSAQHFCDVFTEINDVFLTCSQSYTINMCRKCLPGLYNSRTAQ